MTTVIGKALGLLPADDVKAGSKLRGRVDVRHTLEDYVIQASVTDATVQDTEAAPWLKEAIVTVNKQHKDVGLMAGYDMGTRGAFAGVTAQTDVLDREVNVGATWFQTGNHVRAEGSVKLDEHNRVWATKTLNDEGNAIGNSTVVNLQERKAFVIAPFNVPVSTGAAKYTFTHDDWTIEPAYDFAAKSGFVSVSKPYKNARVAAHYAVADEVGMVTVAYNKDDEGSAAPLVTAYAKAPAGRGGVGPLSIGFWVDKAVDF